MKTGFSEAQMQEVQSFLEGLQKDLVELSVAVGQQYPAKSKSYQAACEALGVVDKLRLTLGKEKV